MKNASDNGGVFLFLPGCGREMPGQSCSCLKPACMVSSAGTALRV